MTPTNGSKQEPNADSTKREARGKAAFAILDYVIKVAVAVFVVLGLSMVVIALSGVEMARLDDHEIFRYRMPVGFALIAGYLLIDYVLGRRRARRAIEAEAALKKSATETEKFALSIDSDADRGAAEIAMERKPQHKRSYTAELASLAIVAAGGAAFWHDHITHEIPNPIAVEGKFVSATCHERERRGTVVRGPHMSIGYEFPSQSTSPRTPQIKCLLDNCEPQKAPPQYMDSEYKTIYYDSLAECKAALPAVLASKASVTVWTGDKDPNAAIRARFTPERDPPPYFLLWIPSIVAAVVLLVSIVRRIRSARNEQ